MADAVNDWEPVAPDDWEPVEQAAPPLAQLQPTWSSDPLGKIAQMSQDITAGAPEALGNAATGMAAAIPAGLAGLGTSVGNLLGMTDKSPTDVINDVQDALTYKPETDEGKKGSEALNDVLSVPAKAGGYLGEKTLDLTGSPALAAAVDTATQFLGPGLLGVEGLKEGHVADDVPLPHEAQPEAAAPTPTERLADLRYQYDQGHLDEAETAEYAALQHKDAAESVRQGGLNQKFLQESGGDDTTPDTKVDLKDHGFSDAEIARMADNGMADPKDGTMDREQFWNYSENKGDLDRPAYVEPEKTAAQASPLESKEDIEANPLPGNLDDHLDHATAKMARDMMTSDDPEMSSQFTAWLEQNAHDPEQVKASLDNAADKHRELEPELYEKPNDVQIDRGNGIASEEGQPRTADESAQARPQQGEPPAPETPASGMAAAESAARPENRAAAETGVQPDRDQAGQRVQPESEPLKEVSARNAAIDAQREAMGMEPLPVAERKTFDESAAQARDMVAKDPGAAQRIVTEHAATGRALTDPEQLVLAEHAAKLGNDHEAATAEINRARTAGDDMAGKVATLRRDAIENQARAVHKALNQGGGTANARALAIRNAILKDDYSVGRNMARAEDHYGGLNERLRSQARDLTDQIKRHQDELERAQAGVEKERSAQPARQTKPQLSPDERMQQQIQRKIDKMQADIERRLKACPL